MDAYNAEAGGGRRGRKRGRPRRVGQSLASGAEAGHKAPAWQAVHGLGGRGGAQGSGVAGSPWPQGLGPRPLSSGRTVLPVRPRPTPTAPPIPAHRSRRVGQSLPSGSSPLRQAPPAPALLSLATDRNHGRASCCVRCTTPLGIGCTTQPRMPGLNRGQRPGERACISGGFYL